MRVLTCTFYWQIAIISLFACNNPANKNLPLSNKQLYDDTINVKLELVTDSIRSPLEYIAGIENSHQSFIADNNGTIWILKNGTLLPKPFLNLNDSLAPGYHKTKHSAIFSVAFHPDYTHNGKFFVCYASPVPKRTGFNRLLVSEFSVHNDGQEMVNLTSEHHVFELEGKNIQNNGAQIAFGPDGYLYVSIGDDKLGDTTYTYHAQDLNYLNGKLLRIDINKTPYGIPADNPFVGIKNARPEIWAYGFRKLWRFSFDNKSNAIIGADVGELKQEEIDLVKKGGNYGWPMREGDSIFQNSSSNNQAGFIAPIHAYTRKDGICVIGGGVYNGLNIPQLLQKYFFADFNGNLYALSKDDEGHWKRQVVNIMNKPVDPFLICGCSKDEHDELIILGMLNTKEGFKGAVYRIIPG